MRTKKTKLSNFKLSDAARGALESDTVRTGKTMTQVLEDRLLWQRVFNEDAEAVLDGLRRKTGLPTYKIVEVCILKAAKADVRLPFEATPTNEPALGGQRHNGIVGVRGSSPLDSTNPAAERKTHGAKVPGVPFRPSIFRSGKGEPQRISNVAYAEALPLAA